MRFKNHGFYFIQFKYSTKTVSHSYYYNLTGLKIGGGVEGFRMFVEYVIHSTNTMKSVKCKQWFMLLHRLRISFLQLNPQWTRIIRLWLHCFWLRIHFVRFISIPFLPGTPNKKTYCYKKKNQIVIVVVSWWAFNRQIAGLSALS